MVEKKQENVSNFQKDRREPLRNSNLELREQLQTEDAALESLRCERNDSDANEAIFDCTGGENVNTQIFISKRPMLCRSF